MGIKRIMLIPNTLKENIDVYIEKVAGFFISYGTEVFMASEIMGIVPPMPKVRFMPYDMCMRDCDAAVVLGGDGTILHAAKKASLFNVPLLGINIGNIGFMTELEPDEIPLLEEMIKGNYEIDQRMMLNLKVIRNDKVVLSDDALNDVVMTKGNVLRMINAEIYSDGLHVITISGDGVIICTPTGSTAYSLSSGGPVIEPSSENITITPICPHALYAKSFVLAPTRTVMIKPLDLKHKTAIISVDGGEPFKLNDGDSIMVRRSKAETKLIRIKGKSFYEILNHKLSR